MDTIHFNNQETILLAFKTYANNNIDIVDCILYAYSKIEDKDVIYFDKN